MKQTRITRRAQGWRLATYTVTTVLAMAIAGQVLAAAADETSGMTRACRDLYREWGKKLAHRAFAASKVVGGLQACDISWGWESREKAIAKAIRLCKRNDYYLNLKLGHTCRLAKVF